MRSEAATVEAYLAELDPGDRGLVEELLALARANLPPGFEERMQYGMPSFVVPLAAYPQGYLGDPRVPLPFVSVAAQKRHVALYHLGLYAEPGRLGRFLADCEAETGFRPDMGKSCLRIASPARLPKAAVARLLGELGPADWIARYERSRGEAGEPAR